MGHCSCEKLGIEPEPEWVGYDWEITETRYNYTSYSYTTETYKGVVRLRNELYPEYGYTVGRHSFHIYDSGEVWTIQAGARYPPVKVGQISKEAFTISYNSTTSQSIGSQIHMVGRRSVD